MLQKSGVHEVFVLLTIANAPELPKSPRDLNFSRARSVRQTLRLSARDFLWNTALHQVGETCEIALHTHVDFSSYTNLCSPPESVLRVEAFAIARIELDVAPKFEARVKARALHFSVESAVCSSGDACACKSDDCGGGWYRSRSHRRGSTRSRSGHGIVRS